jgi:hypothetical protein
MDDRDRDRDDACDSFERKRAGECGARSPPASSSSIAQATFFVYEQI